MKLKYSSISKGMICMLVLMHLCFFLIPFSNVSLFATSYISKPRMMLFLVIVIMSLATGMYYRRKNNTLLLEMTLLLICFVRGMIGGLEMGKPWDNSLVLVWNYVYPLLAFPLFYMLCSGKWEIEKLAQFLVFVATVDNLAKAFMSLYESVSGTILWKNMVVGEMGYRNGLYRINPSELSLIVIPIAFWLLQSSDSKKEKSKYIFAIAVDALYAFVIWQGRSAMLYKAAILVLLFVIQKGPSRKKFIRIIAVFGAVVVFLNTAHFENFIASFSSSNTVTGGSTFFRLNAIGFYISKYLQNPFWGIGCLETAERHAVGGGMLEDCGVLFGLVQLGIPMILYYCVIFIRGLYVSYKVKKNNPIDSLLCFSMTLLIMMFGINIDPFYGFAISMPFYIAITEFIMFRNRLSIRTGNEIY